MRRNFSLVARYSLKFTHCSLLVVKSPVTRCKICSLLVAKVSLCKKPLVTRWRSFSLQKVTRYSLRNSLVSRCRSCLLLKITRQSLQNLFVARCKKSLVTRCKIRLLLVQKVARYKKSLATHCTANFDRQLLCKVTNKNHMIYRTMCIFVSTPNYCTPHAHRHFQ